MKFITRNDDPMGELLADPAFRDAYMDALCTEYERDHHDGVAEEEEPPPWVEYPKPDAAERQGEFESFLDLDRIAREQRALAAHQDCAIHQLLLRAEADPEPWLGPDPTDDPGWIDPRGRTHAAVRAQRRQYAARAAAADVATRLHLSETAVRNRAYRAEVLSARCPRLWQRYLAGDITEQNASFAATMADSLPARDRDTWRAFDEAIADAAATLAPGRFRTRARAVRERVHPTTLAERRQRAMVDRGVWIEPDLDGMATLSAVLPAEQALAIDNALERHARHLKAQSGEDRTLAQLRADVFCDLMSSASIRPADSDKTSGAGGATGSPGIVATVNLTIPALTLLGHSTEPATLAGYGPIDIDTARALAGTATSFIRVLTDPVTGTVLDIDRRAYRIPADLKRWLRIQHPTCVFPGCHKPSDRCDIDHRKRWSDGGTTSADNTAPLCERHHVLKDETRWQNHRDPGTGAITWTSPSGNFIPDDPPPF